MERGATLGAREVSHRSWPQKQCQKRRNLRRRLWFLSTCGKQAVCDTIIRVWGRVWGGVWGVWGAKRCYEWSSRVAFWVYLFFDTIPNIFTKQEHSTLIFSQVRRNKNSNNHCGLAQRFWYPGWITAYTRVHTNEWSWKRPSWASWRAVVSVWRRHARTSGQRSTQSYRLSFFQNQSCPPAYCVETEESRSKVVVLT